MRYLNKGLLTLLVCSSVSISAFANFTQAPLPYKSDALEPAIDQQTMEIHYGKHHKAYVDNLNAQIKTYPELDKLNIEQIQQQISKYNAAVRNNGGGHFNHAFFWESLAQLIKQVRLTLNC